MTTALRIARTAAGMTQAGLGAASGVSRQTVVAIEKGSCPSLSTALRMARALGTGVADLFPEHAPGTDRHAASTATIRLETTIRPRPCLAVDHVLDRDALTRLVGRLVVLRKGDPVLVRRGDDLAIVDGTEQLVVCEEAAGAVTMDRAGGIALVDMLLASLISAARRGDTETIMRQNDLLRDVGRMILGLLGDDLSPVTELLVEAPMPWSALPVVRPDQQSGIGMWGEPRADLGRHVPDMPSILQFSTTDGRIHARGWGRRVILDRERPDAMETLRLCASVERTARELMDHAARTG